MQVPDIILRRSPNPARNISRLNCSLSRANFEVTCLTVYKFQCRMTVLAICTTLAFPAYRNALLQICGFNYCKKHFVTNSKVTNIIVRPSTLPLHASPSHQRHITVPAFALPNPGPPVRIGLLAFNRGRRWTQILRHMENTVAVIFVTCTYFWAHFQGQSYWSVCSNWDNV